MATDSTYNLEEVYEELLAQKEELSTAIDFLQDQNRELEHQLELVNKKNRELDLIIYRMYHDLKSPITSAQGLIDISKHISYDEFIHQIRPTILKMSRDLYNMIDFAKSFTHNDHKEEENTPLQTFRAEIENIYKEDLNNQPYQLNWHIDEIFEISMPVRITLKQLLLNSLFFRSIQHTLQVEVYLKKTEEAFEIEVIDNGIGMSAETKEKCTEMFYRGTPQSKGSGLGLYVVKTFVENTDGSLNIISNEGNGCHIKVSLPLRN